jgi:antitoxin VapB
VALQERKDRILAAQGLGRARRLHAFLTHEAWPQLVRHDTGEIISKAEREQLLGYGPEGV